MCVQVHYLVERFNQIQKCVLHNYLFVLWLNLFIGQYSFSQQRTWYLSCQNNRCRLKPSRCLPPFVVELLALSLFLCHENNILTHQDHSNWIFFVWKQYSSPFVFQCILSFAKRKRSTLCFVINVIFFNFSLLISLQGSRTWRTLETLALTLDFSIICFVVNCELEATRKIARLSRSDNDDSRPVLFFLP